MTGSRVYLTSVAQKAQRSAPRDWAQLTITGSNCHFWKSLFGHKHMRKTVRMSSFCAAYRSKIISSNLIFLSYWLLTALQLSTVYSCSRSYQTQLIWGSWRANLNCSQDRMEEATGFAWGRFHVRWNRYGQTISHAKHGPREFHIFWRGLHPVHV